MYKLTADPDLSSIDMSKDREKDGVDYIEMKENGNIRGEYHTDKNINNYNEVIEKPHVANKVKHHFTTGNNSKGYFTTTSSENEDNYMSDRTQRQQSEQHLLSVFDDDDDNEDALSTIMEAVEPSDTNQTSSGSVVVVGSSCSPPNLLSESSSSQNLLGPSSGNSILRPSGPKPTVVGSAGGSPPPASITKSHTNILIKSSHELEDQNDRSGPVSNIDSSVSKSLLNTHHMETVNSKEGESHDFKSGKDLKTSYTVQESYTVEKAIADGLPVIYSSEINKHDEQGGYIDLNTSQDVEVSGMESEQKMDDDFLLRDSAEVIDHFLHRTSFDTTRLGRVKNSNSNIPATNTTPSQVLFSSTDTPNNPENNLLKNQHIKRTPDKVSSSYDVAKMNTRNPILDSKQTRSLDVGNLLQKGSNENASFFVKNEASQNNTMVSSNRTDESAPLIASNTKVNGMKQLPERTLNNSKSLLTQSHSVPSATSSLIKGSSKYLSQSFDGGLYRQQLSSREALPPPSEEKSTSLSRDERGGDIIFNQVSYNHWPFTRSSGVRRPTEKVSDANGKEICVESLNGLLHDGHRESPVTLSWVEEGSNAKPRLSLEEREERLRKVCVKDVI